MCVWGRHGGEAGLWMDCPLWTGRSPISENEMGGRGRNSSFDGYTTVCYEDIQGRLNGTRANTSVDYLIIALKGISNSWALPLLFICQPLLSSLWDSCVCTFLWQAHACPSIQTVSWNPRCSLSSELAQLIRGACLSKLAVTLGPAILPRCKRPTRSLVCLSPNP